MAAKKKKPGQKEAQELIDPVDKALEMLYQAEARYMAELFEDEEHEYMDTEKLAKATTKEEEDLLLHLPDHSGLLETELKPKTEKKPKK